MVETRWKIHLTRVWFCVDDLSRASPDFSPENDAKLEPCVYMEASTVFLRRKPSFVAAISGGDGEDDETAREWAKLASESGMSGNLIYEESGGVNGNIELMVEGERERQWRWNVVLVCLCVWRLEKKEVKGIYIQKGKLGVRPNVKTTKGAH